MPLSFRRHHGSISSLSPKAASGSGRPAVALAGYTKRYGQDSTAVDALRPVDLEMWPGEFDVFLGPSQSGKTTLLNLIGGIDAVASGRPWWPA